MKSVILFIGWFHLVFFLLGVTGLIHYRCYIGPKDMVWIPKEELEQLRANQK